VRAVKKNMMKIKATPKAMAKAQAKAKAEPRPRPSTSNSSIAMNEQGIATPSPQDLFTFFTSRGLEAYVPALCQMLGGMSMDKLRALPEDEISSISQQVGMGPISEMQFKLICTQLC